jgi:hypothetical protein
MPGELAMCWCVEKFNDTIFQRFVHFTFLIFGDGLGTKWTHLSTEANSDTTNVRLLIFLFIWWIGQPLLWHCKSLS